MQGTPATPARALLGRCGGRGLAGKEDGADYLFARGMAARHRGGELLECCAERADRLRSEAASKAAKREEVCGREAEDSFRVLLYG